MAARKVWRGMEGLSYKELGWLTLRGREHKISYRFTLLALLETFSDILFLRK